MALNKLADDDRKLSPHETLVALGHAEAMDEAGNLDEQDNSTLADAPRRGANKKKQRKAVTIQEVIETSPEPEVTDIQNDDPDEGSEGNETVEEEDEDDMSTSDNSHSDEPYDKQLRTDATVTELQSNDDSQQYKQKAFDYFNDLRFFSKKLHKDTFSIDEVPAVLETTVDEFYNTAWSSHKTDEKLMLFFTVNIYGCKSDAVLDDFKEWKTSRGWKLVKRMVPVDYNIENTHLSHSYDLTMFEKEVNGLFNWNVKKNLIGPYACFVQSSGMGKTKLLFEYAKKTNNSDSDTVTQLILCTPSKSVTTKVFDAFLDTKLLIQETDREACIATVHDTLNKILQKSKASRVVLLFDESHTLLDRCHGFDAFLFRCIRVWLREKGRDKKVVAVFTGTNSGLTNFLLEADRKLEYPPDTSRELQRRREYYDKGNSMIPILFQVTTIGCCREMVKSLGNSAHDEYDRMVFYGRPLFAVMAEQGDLDQRMSTVFGRTLLMSRDKDCDWENDIDTCINLLCTRVQLGQPSMQVISNLVSKGYANLCGINTKTLVAKLACLPDPVCARIATCLMDGDFKTVLDGVNDSGPKTINGKPNTWWTAKLKEIFSNGIVSPDKGDFGEVVVALYMLFCGDILRKDMNAVTKRNDKNVNCRDYRTFSVPLGSWLDLLVSGGKRPENDSSSIEASLGTGGSLSVNFIQVCRNSLRSYGKSWESLINSTFLEHVYSSGTAFFVYDGCPSIDMVIPMRLDDEPTKKPMFIPMLVQIKSCMSFAKSKETKALNKMKSEMEALKERPQREKIPVLCLLIVLGETNTEGSKKNIIDSKQVCDKLIKGDDEYIIIHIPGDDEFSLSQALNDMIPIAQLKTELYTSHPFLIGHGDDKELVAENALRSKPGKEFTTEYEHLRRGLTKKKNE